MTRTSIGLLALGALIGWTASRLVLPTPAVVHMSPVVQCGTSHAVEVPFRDNAAWAIRSGQRWWNGKGWGDRAEWFRRAGVEVVTPTGAGIQLLAKGYGSGSIAGATIRGVEVKQPAEPAKEKKS